MNELIVDKVSNSSTVSDAGSFGGYNSQLALLNHGGTKVIGPFDIPALLIRPDLRGFAISDQKERNKLNDLTSKEWIQETKSIWRQKGLGANHEHTAIERLHPAPFSFQDVARLIRFFTKRGMTVFDPFVGVGSTLKAAAIEGRNGLGVELSCDWANLAAQRLDQEVPSHNGQEIWNIDIREALPKIPQNFFEFVVTSPPYWSILNKKPDHKVLNGRVSNGLATNYSSDPRDLGNIADYEAFVDELAQIFNGIAHKIQPGRYCAVIVSDFRHKEKFYSFHSDLAVSVDSALLSLQGITILEQPHKTLYPYGYPYAYVPNVHHQYILIFRRPSNHSVPGRTAISIKEEKSIQASRQVESDQLEQAVQTLTKLPYRMPPMAGRHWGHKLHEFCSFPSKLKPAIAHVLVQLFAESGSVVMDPFSGSGTVSLEAALAGHASISSDISPLAFVITSAKVDPPSPAELEVALRQLEEGIGAQLSTVSLAEMEPEIVTFYDERTALEILAARKHLREATEGFTTNRANIFLTACLAHVLHGNRPYALSRRSHNIIPIPPKGPTEYKSVINAVAVKAKRMIVAVLPESFEPGKAFTSAADCIPVDDQTVDVIITSPPFFGSTDFLRQNRLRNWLVGWDYQNQQRMKSRFLDHDTRISRYAPIARELHRVAKPGGKMVMHLGMVRGENMAVPVAAVFESEGWKTAGLVWEDVTHLESQGRTDRGGTASHGFLVMRRS